MKSFLLLLFFLNFSPILANTRIYPTDGEIKSYFSSIKNEDKGKLGYLKIANELFHGNMETAFRYTSQSVSKKTMQKLNWGNKFSGTTSQFSQERLRILDINQKINFQYQGKEGLISYADQFHQGSMHKTFSIMAAVLNAEEFDKLNWGKQFSGTTTEFKETRIRVLDVNGNIKTEYLGQKGYQLYADHFYNGSMGKAFKNLPAALNAEEFKKISWGKEFSGKTSEFREIQNMFFDADRKIRHEYIGQAGYIFFADQYYQGSMKKTFVNVSAVLNAAEFKELSWGKQFAGSTTEFKETRERIFNQYQNIRVEYIGQQGLLLYADRFYQGNMQKAFKNLSATLTPTEFQKLSWGKIFSGTTAEFRATRASLFDRNKKLRSEYRGQEGYLLYADRFYLGSMKKTYLNLSAVLTKAEFNQLSWGKQFSGRTSEFKETRTRIFDINGNIKTEYVGQEGYLLYADRFYLGSMLTAFKNLAAVLNAPEFQKLFWGKAFTGTTAEFSAGRGRVFNSYGILKAEYYGQQGYLLYADQYHLGSMNKAFSNLSALLSEAEFKQLSWGNLYTGTTAEYHDMRKLLKNGGTEIDYEKWFGKSFGLKDIVNEYIYRHGNSLSYKKEITSKVRQQFRTVVSNSELQLLGWDNVKAIKPEKISLSPKALREKIKAGKSLIIDIKDSIKRGSKK